MTTKDKGSKKAGKEKPTEIVAAAPAEPSASESDCVEMVTSPGPTTGGRSPLFPGMDPELKCEITRDAECVIVRFNRQTPRWSMKKRQTKLACRLIDAQASELRAKKVDEIGEIEADLDMGAEIENDGGEVVVSFDKPVREWKLHKRGAQLATGLIRARARPLPTEVT